MSKFANMPTDTITINGLYKRFPGLFNGEDVSGADLKSYISDEVQSIIQEGMTSAEVFRSQVENWKDAEPEPPYMWAVEPYCDEEGYWRATMAFISEDGELRLENRIYGRTDPRNRSYAVHSHYSREEGPIILHQERAQLLALFINEHFGVWKAPTPKPAPEELCAAEG